MQTPERAMVPERHFTAQCIDGTLEGIQQEIQQQGGVRVLPVSSLHNVPLENLLFNLGSMPVRFTPNRIGSEDPRIPLPPLDQNLLQAVEGARSFIPAQPNARAGVETLIEQSDLRMTQAGIEIYEATQALHTPVLRTEDEMPSLVKAGKLVATPLDQKLGWKIVSDEQHTDRDGFFLVIYPRIEGEQLPSPPVNPFEMMFAPPVPDGVQVVSLATLIEQNPEALKGALLRYHTAHELGSYLQQVIGNLAIHDVASQQMVTSTIEALALVPSQDRERAIIDVLTLFGGLSEINPSMKQVLSDRLKLWKKRTTVGNHTVSTDVFLGHRAQCKAEPPDEALKIQAELEVYRRLTGSRAKMSFNKKSHDAFVPEQLDEKLFLANPALYTDAVVAQSTFSQTREKKIRSREDLIQTYFPGFSIDDFNHLAEDMKVNTSEEGQRAFAVALQIYYLVQQPVINGNRFVVFGRPLFDTVVAELFPTIPPGVWNYLQSKLPAPQLPEGNLALPPSANDSE